MSDNVEAMGVDIEDAFDDEGVELSPKNTQKGIEAQERSDAKRVIANVAVEGGLAVTAVACAGKADAATVNPVKSSETLFPTVELSATPIAPTATDEVITATAIAATEAAILAPTVETSPTPEASIEATPLGEEPKFVPMEDILADRIVSPYKDPFPKEASFIIDGFSTLSLDSARSYETNMDYYYISYIGGIDKRSQAASRQSYVKTTDENGVDWYLGIEDVANSDGTVGRIKAWFTPEQYSLIMSATKKGNSFFSPLFLGKDMTCDKAEGYEATCNFINSNNKRLGIQDLDWNQQFDLFSQWVQTGILPKQLSSQYYYGFGSN